jgi:plasmid replication initiation protein
MRTRKNASDNQQPDLFVPYLSDLALRDQRETMERPFFSLSKRKRITPIEYHSPDGSVWIKVEAVPAYGMATIWDADILIWVASTLVEMRDRGVTELPRTLRFHPYNLLKAIQRDVGGEQYKRLREALERLKGTLISTNIRGDKKTLRAMFGWLDDWSEVIDEDTQQTKEMSITLSNWIYQGIIMQGGVLSVHPDYFLLTGGLERCLYRIARKHAGMQSQGWVCTISTLYEKTGSESSRKEFTRMLRKITTANTLPEYHLQWIERTESGESAIHMIRRSVLPASHPEFHFPVKKSRVRPYVSIE